MSRCSIEQWKTGVAVVILLLAGFALVTGEAHASTATFGGGGFGGFGGSGALGTLITQIKGHLQQLVSVAIVGIAAMMLFAKAVWMEMLGAFAFMAALGMTAVWAMGSMPGFFGDGAIL